MLKRLSIKDREPARAVPLLPIGDLGLSFSVICRKLAKIFNPDLEKEK
jgi:hypothetical protein